MYNARFTASRACALALSALLAAACDSSVGVDYGAAIVTMQRAATGQPAAGFASAASGGTSFTIPEDTVASLTVSVTAIQFLRVGGDSSDGTAWTSLALDAPVELDLIALPSEGQSPLVIAQGSVAAGGYSAVRLFVENPRIEFKGSFQFGATVTLNGGVEYQVTIPSGAETGIKTDLSFTVQASAAGSGAAAVGLLFDAGSSFANATATGTGQVILAPVIRASGN